MKPKPNVGGKVFQSRLLLTTAVLGIASVALAAVINFAPAATGEPAPRAEPIPCNTVDDEGGEPSPGQGQGPFSDRQHGDSAVRATFTLSCTRNVRVKLAYTITEYYQNNTVKRDWSGYEIVDVVLNPSECTPGVPCTTMPFNTKTFPVGGSFKGTRKFVFTGTAYVYPAGAVVTGVTPTPNGQELQIGNIIPSTAML